MNTLRENPPTKVGDYNVLSARDYKLDTIKDLNTNEVKPTGLPSSNVLYYDMSDNAWLCVRPSGTEPKIKFYYGVVGTSLEDAEYKSKELAKKVLELIETMN
jgi:phosphoglucomutase